MRHPRILVTNRVLIDRMLKSYIYTVSILRYVTASVKFFIVIFIVLKYCNSFELPIEIVRNNWSFSTLIYIEIDNSMRIIYILLLNIV